MDIVGACLLDGFPTDNKLSLKTSKSAAKGGLKTHDSDQRNPTLVLLLSLCSNYFPQAAERWCMLIDWVRIRAQTVGYKLGFDSQPHSPCSRLPGKTREKGNP